MTNEQRMAIAGYRQAGYGYKKIAQMTGVNTNTVKTYCRRNGLSGTAETMENLRFCKCCGAPVKQNPGRKEKKFCSDQCRTKWWNSHLDLVNRKAIYNDCISFEYDNGMVRTWQRR